MIELLGTTSTLVAVFLTLVVAYLGYRYLYKPYTYFDGLGIPGPRPVPILGNLGMLWQFKGSFDLFINHLLKEYGKICRVFYGTEPGVMFADPDDIKEVMIKRFDNFTNRQSFNSFSIDIGGEAVHTLDIERGENWRRRRRVLTPAFSVHKLKLTAPLVKESVDRLVEICRGNADKGQTVDALEMFRGLTMEVILATAFGCQVNVQKSGTEAPEPLYQAAQELIVFINSEDAFFIPVQMLADVNPAVWLLLTTLMKAFKLAKPMDNMVELCRAIVRKRKAEMEKGDLPRKDILQLLMEASQEGDKHTISESEMVADVILMMLAGYDTTSNTLAYVAYRLAVHSEIQDKLADQVLQYFEDNPDKTALDAAQEVEYVEMVISETQRMHPPVFFTDRQCTKPCTVAGVPFKEGMFAIIPIECVHYDPDLWPEPSKFDPERFSSEEKANRHPCAYLPFGLGPRNCVGMRFALMEAKMALIEIVRNFRILKTPETKVPLETRGLFLKTPAPGATSVRFELRAE